MAAFLLRIANEAASSYARSRDACDSAQTRTLQARILRPVDSVSRLGPTPARPSNHWNIMTQFTRTSILVAAIALSALAGCASSHRQESTGQYVDDTALTGKVKAAIFNEPTLKSAEINVETFKGRVQLSGFVRSRANIDTAVRIAQEVGGVSSVANDMRVK